jgi:hypothetical protein
MRGRKGSILSRYPYVAIAVLLLALLIVIYQFQSGAIGFEAARVYVDALGMVATLALLYFAYINIISVRYENVASAELAVRPIFGWELAGDGQKAFMTYYTARHPVYDLKIEILMGNGRMGVEERHLEVREVNPLASRKQNVTKFVLENMKEGGGKLTIRISYHSELGGKYEFEFTKEVTKKGSALLFHHRKFHWAKYPWKEDITYFE